MGESPDVLSLEQERALAEVQISLLASTFWRTDALGEMWHATSVPMKGLCDDG
jgi:hypothetical protein